MARRSKRATAPLPAPVQLAPEAGQVFAAPRQQQRPLDEALDAKPAQFVAIFKEAALGRTRRIVDLGKSARRYDPRLNSVSSTRVLAIGSRGYAIKPPPGTENDAEAQRIADFVGRHFYETRNFPTLKQHLGHGALECHAVLEHVWSRNARGEVRTQPVWRHPNRFAWTQETGEIAKLDPGVDTTPIPLSNWPNKFIVHSAVGGQSDYPWMRGALRPLLMLSLSGRFGLRWWLSCLERFGQPQVYATQRPGDKSADLISALRALGSDWRAVVPEGSSFTALPVTVQDQLHQRFLDYVNTEKAIGILGQNLSTEVKGGSYAAAKSQERVRADILAADLAELDETITDQWIRPLVLFNFGPGAPVPYIEHTLDARVPFTLADYQAGVCTVDQYLSDNGHDPEPDGKGDRYYQAPTSYQMTPGGGGAGAPFSVTPILPSQGPKLTASPTSSTSPSTTHPLRSALSRR